MKKIILAFFLLMTTPATAYVGGCTISATTDSNGNTTVTVACQIL